jgi:hypothetical protein
LPGPKGTSSCLGSGRLGYGPVSAHLGLQQLSSSIASSSSCSGSRVWGGNGQAGPAGAFDSSQQQYACCGTLVVASVQHAGLAVCVWVFEVSALFSACSSCGCWACSNSADPKACRPCMCSMCWCLQPILHIVSSRMYVSACCYFAAVGFVFALCCRRRCTALCQLLRSSPSRARAQQWCRTAERWQQQPRVDAGRLASSPV